MDDPSIWVQELNRHLQTLHNEYRARVDGQAQWRRRLALLQAERQAEVQTLQEKLVPTLAANEELVQRTSLLENECRRLKKDLVSKDELVRKLRDNYAEKRRLLTQVREELEHAKQVVQSATAQLDRKEFLMGQLRAKCEQAKAAETLAAVDREKLACKVDAQAYVQKKIR